MSTAMRVRGAGRVRMTDELSVTHFHSQSLLAKEMAKESLVGKEVACS